MRSEEILNEVPMNPTAFAQGVEAGVEKGVKVGFEFEICVPKETIEGKTGNDDSSQWWEGIISEFPKWYNEFDLLELSDDILRINTPIKYQGQSYKSITDLTEAWISSKIEDKVKAVFDSCKPATKKRIISHWKQAKASGTRNTSYQFAIVCSYTTNSYKLRVEFNRAGDSYRGIPSNEFWMEVFGTDQLALLAQNPAITFDPEEFKNQLGFNSYYDLDDYDLDDYEGASKVLAPIIKQAFGSAIVFRSYHQNKKSLTKWYIEPDESIAPVEGDGAVEIVSPPLLVNDAIYALKQFYTIARQLKLYTGAEHSTGLHINVSIPKGLDVLKLAVFLGDEHLLKKWGREDNEYVNSMIKTLRGEMSSEFDALNVKTKRGYSELLSLAKDVSDEHAASISYNGTYVSFRHAGGDYLNQQQGVLDVVGRFVRAMVIASDKKLYRKEYLTKLVKLINDSEPDRTYGYPQRVNEILKFRNQPIDCVAIGLYVLKNTVSENQLWNRSPCYNTDILLPKPASTEILNQLVRNPAITDSPPIIRYYHKISSIGNKRALYIRLRAGSQPTEARVIRSLAGQPIGVSIEQPIQLQPGTLAHNMVLQRVLEQFKQQKLGTK